MPLRYWNQQAHFTTPASGTPGKAIKGLGPAGKILTRFGISADELAETSGAPLDALKDLLEGENKHSPFVMVDVEDAVALTEESIHKARRGAVHCFTQEDWGPTLPFYRPAGLRLESCVADMITVLTEVAKDRAPEDYPVAGIVWPKSEHPDEIAWVCDVLAKIEKKLGLTENQIKFEYLVESGYALNQIAEIAKACAHRLVGIVWGIADYSADANLPRIQNDHPLCDWARYEIVNIAGSLGVPAIDNMTLNYPTPIHRGADLSAEQQEDNKKKVLGALKEVYDDALHGIELGMSGKWVGHPAQLLMVMAAFREAIPQAQIEKDLKDIADYSQSVASGAGATMLGDGKAAYMADRATDRHIRARLRRATAWRRLDAARALELGLITETESKQLGG
jgi:citrate lyase beta subunit